MANIFDLASSYAKQETNPETLTRAKLAPHHTPEEHKLDDDEFTNKQICTICQLGASSAPSKMESLNRRELLARVMNAGGKHPDLGGRVVQQGGSTGHTQLKDMPRSAPHWAPHRRTRLEKR